MPYSWNPSFAAWGEWKHILRSACIFQFSTFLLYPVFLHPIVNLIYVPGLSRGSINLRFFASFSLVWASLNVLINTLLWIGEECRLVLIVLLWSSRSPLDKSCKSFTARDTFLCWLEEYCFNWLMELPQIPNSTQFLCQWLTMSLPKTVRPPHEGVIYAS